MVLRLTMAEFRKIPSNDKLLFGILIAIIVFNSMIPRVVEGLPEKYFFNTNTPTITSATKGNAPTVDDNVVSISGSFRTSHEVPAGNSIIFKFPQNYFAQLQGTALSTVRLNIQKGGVDVVPPPAASGTGTTQTQVTTTSTASDLMGGTISFSLATGVTIPASGNTDRDYTFKIYSTNPAPNTPIFKFGASPIGITANGFKISSQGFTEAAAAMPVLYKESTASSGSGSQASASMSARQAAFVNNVSNLQAVEQELFEKLSSDTNLTPADRAQIVSQINQLAKARGDLYNNMNDFSAQIETVAGERRNALVQNSVAVSVIQDQIQNSQRTLDGLQQEKSNKMRLVEINNYYGKKYEFQTDIMKIIILTCVPILIISVLLKKGFIPNLIATGLMIIIISAGLIAVAHKVIDLNKRNKFNFDQYDHPFNPNAVQVRKVESTNLSDINKMSLASSCIGPSCCTENTTQWDSASAKCVPKPAQGAASNAAPVPGSLVANAQSAVVAR
jgi:hypothetical protein